MILGSQKDLKTYLDKVDDDVPVANILVDVQGERGAHHGLQKDAMGCGDSVCGGGRLLGVV